MGIWKDLLGTTSNTLGIGKAKALISAANLTAQRLLFFPDKSGTFVVNGSITDASFTASGEGLLGAVLENGYYPVRRITLSSNLYIQVGTDIGGNVTSSILSLAASGSTGQVQVNNGVTFAGYAGFTYNFGTGVLTVAGITGNAGTVTTNANLTGPITSTGNATAVASQTGTGSTFVMQASPTLTTPNIGTPSAGVMTNVTGTAAGLTAGNSSQLLGSTWAAPGAIGSTTRNTGAFSALTTTGNVGIGTTTPDMSLTIYGPSIIPASNYDALLNLYSTDALGAGVGGGILFGGNYVGTTKTGWAEISGVKEDAISGNYGGILKFKTRDNGGAMGTRMTILSGNGNVGLGASLPLTKLQVGDKVSDDNAVVYDANSLMVVHQTATATATLNDPKATLLLARQGTAAQAFGAAAAFNLSRYENTGTNSRTRLDISLAHNSFDVMGNTVMTFLSSGNVGIGTTGPTTNFYAKGTTNVMTVQASNGAGNRFLSFAYADTGAGTYGNFQIQASTLVLQAGNFGGKLHLTPYNGGTYNNALGLTVDSAGNVGIGTTSPVNKLEVDGTIKPKVYTVATLPSASTMGNGARSHVSDSNSSTFAATVAGGGSTSVPVYSDGTNWKIG